MLNNSVNRCGGADAERAGIEHPVLKMANLHTVLVTFLDGATLRSRHIGVEQVDSEAMQCFITETHEHPQCWSDGLLTTQPLDEAHREELLHCRHDSVQVIGYEHNPQLSVTTEEVAVRL